jgi:hypothetical protein
MTVAPTLQSVDPAVFLFGLAWNAERRSGEMMEAGEGY